MCVGKLGHNAYGLLFDIHERGFDSVGVTFSPSNIILCHVCVFKNITNVIHTQKKNTHLPEQYSHTRGTKDEHPK